MCFTLLHGTRRNAESGGKKKESHLPGAGGGYNSAAAGEEEPEQREAERQRFFKDVYHRNFERYAGSAPRPLDVGRAIQECERVIREARARPELHEFLPVLDEILERTRALEATATA